MRRSLGDSAVNGVCHSNAGEQVSWRFTLDFVVARQVWFLLQRPVVFIQDDQLIDAASRGVPIRSVQDQTPRHAPGLFCKLAIRVAFNRRRDDPVHRDAGDVVARRLAQHGLLLTITAPVRRRLSEASRASGFIRWLLLCGADDFVTIV